MRNLTKTIAAVSFLVPASAYSLGIGDIKLHSALNQTLEAEIALLVSEGENISDLRVRLAPPEKFDEAGIPWSYFLSKMKFVPVLRPDGSAIVKVSSREVLKEPFLDFLVEVTWEKGNLYREFTVLVDPPVAYTQPVVPVVQKAEQTVTPPAREERVVTRKSLTKEIVGDSGVYENDGEYGPIRRNETLWKIAEKTNTHKDVSIEQMMMALYEVNQKAFYGNVNTLKAGQTLDIPEKEVIFNLTKEQALAAFNQHTKEWKGKALARKNDQSSQVATKSKAQLDLKAPVEGEIGETAIVVSDDLPANQIAELEKEKSAAALSDEGLALQSRMEKLEQQLEMMQKMLVLKDEQLLVLQQELDNVPSKLKAEEGQQETGLQQGVDPAEKPVKAEVKQDTEVAKVEEPSVEKKKELQPESKSDWKFPMMSAIAIPLLGGLGWLLWRRKKNNEQMDAESMFSSAAGISLPDSSDQAEMDFADDSNLDETSSFGGVPTNESSLLGEFETSDLNSFYTEQSEVDPVLEADVYLAYGRHQQAEELMLQAIVDQPNRDECKLKLLEVYQTDENKNAFEKYSTELLNAGRHNDEEFWGKVVEMGTKLNIEPGLLGKGIGEKAHFDLDEESSSEKDSNVAESGDDTLLSEEEADDGEEAVEETANEMEFDLSIFDEDEKELDLEIKGEKDDNGLDFDLSQFDLDDSVANPAVEKDTATDSDDNDLEVIASEVEENLETEKSKNIEDIESFDFDLEEKDELDDKAESGSEVELKDFDFNNLSSNIAGEKETESSALGTATQESLTEVSDLTDEDELETKIDLAKAYIDMEDTDSARAIAEEVLEKGSEKQKQEAQEIIKQIG